MSLVIIYFIKSRIVSVMILPSTVLKCRTSKVGEAAPVAIRVELVWCSWYPSRNRPCLPICLPRKLRLVVVNGLVERILTVLRWHRRRVRKALFDYSVRVLLSKKTAEIAQPKSYNFLQVLAPSFLGHLHVERWSDERRSFASEYYIGA